MPPIAPTGVVPGNYGGAEVNAAGQFTYISPQWPASALPVYPGAGGGGGGSAATTASAVSYVPLTGNQYVLATNVQVALSQIDAALVTVNDVALNSGVMSVATGTGVTLTGTGSNPVLSLSTTGISAGIYAGFTLNAQGQVLAYTAPPFVAPVINGSTSVGVVQSPVGTWTVSGVAASNSAPGVVRLINPADTLTDTVPLDRTGDVLTWDGLKNYFLGNTVVLPGSGITVLGAARTVSLSLTALPSVLTLEETAVTVLYSPVSAANVQVSLANLRRMVRGGVCTGLWNVASATLSSSFNIASVTGAAGNITVTMIAAQPSVSYGVTIDPAGGNLVGAFYTVISAGVFTVQWTPGGSAATGVSFLAYPLA